MQLYQDFPDTDTLAESRPLILDNDRTIMSCSSGTTFPADVGIAELGMLCYRTDQLKLYLLKDIGTTPFTWNLVADLSGGSVPLTEDVGDARYALTGHDHNYDVNGAWLGVSGGAANVKLDGNSMQMAFKTAGTTIYSAGLTADPFIWQFDGDAAGNTIMRVSTDGHIWAAAYGELGARFIAKNANDTLSAGTAIYATDGTAQAAPGTGTGKWQYTSGRWDISGGSDSSAIASFFRAGSEEARVDNDGRIWSNSYGYLDAAFVPFQSTNRPGVIKLFRKDADTGHGVQADFDGTLWRLRGYDAVGAFNAECHVGLADNATNATNATHATSATSATSATNATNATNATLDSGGLNIHTTLTSYGTRITNLEAHFGNCNCGC